ncbi:MAG: tyrosine-type recombinase/integrase [Anaerolineae bacterium]|nr:tyrosine-type recombinase/integrase [Anaerolineae bacterium]
MIDLDRFQRQLVAGGAAMRTARAYVSDIRLLAARLASALQDGKASDGALAAEVRSFLVETVQSGLRTGTINRRLAAIKRFSSWLVSEGMLAQDIAADVAYVRRQDGAAEEKVPTDLQVKKLLDACLHCRYPKRSRAALLLMLHAGLSVDEIVTLTFSHIERASKASYILMYREGQAHHISLPRAVRQALEAYQLDERGDDVTDHVFVSQKGGPLATVSLRQSLAHCFKAAGLESFSLRSLRGVFARNYLAAHPADLAGLVRLLRVSDWNALKCYFEAA